MADQELRLANRALRGSPDDLQAAFRLRMSEQRAGAPRWLPGDVVRVVQDWVFAETNGPWVGTIIAGISDTRRVLRIVPLDWKTVPWVFDCSAYGREDEGFLRCYPELDDLTLLEPARSDAFRNVG